MSWIEIKKIWFCLRFWEEHSLRVPTAIHSSSHPPNNIPTVINDSLRNTWGSWMSPPHISLLLQAGHLTSLLPFLHLWTRTTTVLRDNYKGWFVVFFFLPSALNLKGSRWLPNAFSPDISQNTPKKATRKWRLLLGTNSTPGLRAASRAVEGHGSGSMSLPVPFTQPVPTLWWQHRALKLLQFAGE